MRSWVSGGKPVGFGRFSLFSETKVDGGSVQLRTASQVQNVDTRRSMRPRVRLKPGKIVLCIDDNEDLLECEKEFLESFGYTVLTAPSGCKALEVASVHSVDVVVVDYLMPEMDGHEVAIKMRQLRPRAPIIMLSAAMDIPEQALRSVDALVAKDQLSSHLLTAIVRLQEC
jgi:CheY-like chemotaxis protein